MQDVQTGSFKSPSARDLAKLSSLSVVFSQLSQADSNSALASSVLELLTEAFGADRGFFRLHAPGSTSPEFELFLDRSSEEESREAFTFTTTWLNRCLESKKPVLMMNSELSDPTKSVSTTGIRSVMLSPMKLKQKVLGVIYLDSLAHVGCFEDNDLKLFAVICEMVAVTVDRNAHAATVFRQSQALDHAEEELKQAAEETIFRLSKAAEFRDGETSEHLTRVSEYCEAVSRKLGLPEGEVESIKVASLLHDVGKLAIPDSIMLKPGRFTDYERKVMQQHTLFGARILADSPNAVIELAASIALRHHEKWDGSGYPHGLSGEEIPLPARIVAIADVFDAVSSARRYKESYSLSDSFSLLEKESGCHFDPDVVEAFLSIRTTIEKIWTENQESEEEEQRKAEAPRNSGLSMTLGQSRRILKEASKQLARSHQVANEERQEWLSAIEFLDHKLEAGAKDYLVQLRSLVADRGLAAHHALEFRELVDTIATFSERSLEPSRTARRVMVVDSDPYQREVVSTEATKRGLSVLEVSSAEEALERIQNDCPEVVVLEVADPGADLIIEKLKEEHIVLPLLVLTRDGELARRLSVSSLSNCAFLHKPLPAAAVVDEIEERLPGSDEDFNITVLALDDDPVVLKIAGRVLRKYGYRTLLASTPEEFWTQLVEHTPDLILLDLEMPFVSGFDICRMLRSDVKYRHLPVIVLTGHQELSKYQKALEAGADDVLSKPLEPHRLLTRIESRLARNRALQLSAGRDPLTGLIHRREALRMCEQMFASTVREGHAFSLCTIEIEAFDKIVEESGWQQSASLLRQVAEILLRDSRPEDVITRCKKHTLLLLLPHLDKSTALQRISSLNTKLKQHKGRLGSLKCVGKVATFPLEGNELKTLLAKLEVDVGQK